MKRTTPKIARRKRPASNPSDGLPRPQAAPALAPVLLVGVDWADREHAYELQAPDGSMYSGTFAQTQEAIAQLIGDWMLRYPGARIELCLEASRGALVNALMAFPQITIYPVNPNALANYRKAFAHGGGKNDPVDAKLILQYLQHYREQLRPLRHDEPLTRELAALCEDRRRLVDQRVALANQLKSLLKLYFPAILLLHPAKIYAEFIVRLLLKYPSLEQAQAAGRSKLRRLLFGVGAKARAEQRLEILMNAQPLTRDEVLLRSYGRRVQAVCGQLDALNRSIAAYDADIKALVRKHAAYPIVASLPGASDKTQGRIIAALGDDRARYASAAALQAAAGIAPLTTQSGKHRHVSSRWACTKFMRQTFHEYAGLSIGKCPWAKAFYEMQLSKGKSPQMAKRALAYKWMRIIYRLWQQNTPYDDAHYVERLKATDSPLVARLATAA